MKPMEKKGRTKLYHQFSHYVVCLTLIYTAVVLCIYTSIHNVRKQVMESYKCIL